MDTLGERGALVAPAFPAQGRTTVGGRQCVNGVPIERTAFGQDGATSDLGALFARSCARGRGCAVAWRPAARRRTPCRSPGAGAPGPPVDCRCRGRLRPRAAGGRGPRVAPARAVRFGRARTRHCGRSPSAGRRGWTTARSRAPASSAVIRTMSEGRRPDDEAGGQCWWWPAVAMPPPPRRWTRCSDTARSSCARRSRYLERGDALRCGADGGARGRRPGDRSSRSSSRRPACRRCRPDRVDVAARLAIIVAGVCDRVRVGGLVLTGGDTASAVCEALGSVEPVADGRTSARDGHRDADWRPATATFPSSPRLAGLATMRHCGKPSRFWRLVREGDDGETLEHDSHHPHPAVHVESPASGAGSGFRPLAKSHQATPAT